MWFFLYKSKVILYIGDQIKMFFKWKVFLFFSPPFSPNGDQQFSFFMCAEEQFRLCLQELAVLGFQYLKHIFWLHPFSHFLIRQQDKKLAERIIFIHWFEEKLWSCVQPSCPLVHVSPEHLLVAEAYADPGVVLDTWIFTYRLLGGHVFISLGVCRSGENTAELWYGCAGWLLCSCHGLGWLLSCACTERMKVEVPAFIPTAPF